MRPLLSAILLSVPIVGIAAPTGAQAQEMRTVGPEASGPGRFVEQARRANAARNAGRWPEAEAAYEAALASAEEGQATATQRAELVGELGLCELTQRKYREAAEHLARSLTQRASLGPMHRRRFDVGRKEAEAHVAKLYLAVSPSDAQVFLDRKPLGVSASSHQIFVEPGRHTVRAHLDGYDDAVSTFDAAVGKSHTMTLELSHASPGPTLRIIGLVAASTATAAGTTFLVWATAIHGDIQERNAELRSQGWASNRCLQSSAAADCNELSDMTEQRDTFAAIGLGSLAAGGALGLVTAASFWFAMPEATNKRTGFQLTPVVTDEQATLMLRTTW